MTDKEVQNSKSEQAGSSGKNGISIRRRRLVTRAAIAVPVVMTVASRPVLGAQCTPSAWVSGNLSDIKDSKVSCGGKPPSHWSAYPNQWVGYKAGNCEEYEHDHVTTKSYTCTEGTRFHKIEGGVFPGTEYKGKSLMYVLKYDKSPDGLGRHCVAALLNASSMPDFGMSAAEVIRIYKELTDTGYFKPSVGDPIPRSEMIAFFKNTYSS